jgi:hypothetical protein
VDQCKRNSSSSRSMRDVIGFLMPVEVRDVDRFVMPVGS